ncbi:TLC domain-containing protein 3A [Aricia agestis]|uniref:TLC domain-containing protein 3A n=1 Tax=Aricia agestis TaxID=91739 RepID=UPI001C20A569|nr:TLC domain-containing protein 3A [Aricia agestis]
MELSFSKTRHQRLVTLALGAVNVGALLGALLLVSGLRPEDRISVRRGAALLGLGLAYFWSLFSLLAALALRTAAGARARRRHRLSAADALDVANKLVSAVQAALCCVAGAVVCAWSCARDFLRASHYMSEAYAWFGAAYFFYDIWSMYTVYVHSVTGGEGGAGGDKRRAGGDAPPKPTFLAYCRHEPVILLHHAFVGGFGFLVIVHLRGGLGDCVFGWVYLMELSTPLVSARGVLARLRLQGTAAYRANGLAMLVVFLLCRVVALPLVLRHYSTVLGLGFWEALGTLPRGCLISMSILLLPQLYWFYLMSRGAIKIFFGKPRAEAAGAGGGAAGGAGEVARRR